MTARRAVILVASVVANLSTAGVARAQGLILPGRFEIGVGAHWIGQESLGARDATETVSNGTSTRLFSTSSDLSSVPTVDAHIGVRLTRSFEAEISGAYGAPTLESMISNDVEATGTVNVTEKVSQFTIGGGLLYYLPMKTPTRWVPFVTGGAAYVRQLHAGGTLDATGETYQLGGGVKYLFRSHPRRVRVVGIRADALAVARVRGVAFDTGARWSPAIGVSLFTRLH